MGLKVGRRVLGVIRRSAAPGRCRCNDGMSWLILWGWWSGSARADGSRHFPDNHIVIEPDQRQAAPGVDNVPVINVDLQGASKRFPNLWFEALQVLFAKMIDLVAAHKERKVPGPRLGIIRVVRVFL